MRYRVLAGLHVQSNPDWVPDPTRPNDGPPDAVYTRGDVFETDIDMERTLNSRDPASEKKFVRVPDDEPVTHKPLPSKPPPPGPGPRRTRVYGDVTNPQPTQEKRPVLKASDEELEALTIQELNDIAAEEEVEHHPGGNKNTLIQAIRKTRAAKAKAKEAPAVQNAQGGQPLPAPVTAEVAARGKK